MMHRQLLTRTATSPGASVSVGVVAEIGVEAEVGVVVVAEVVPASINGTQAVTRVVVM